jgi:hypothetical protein
MIFADFTAENITIVFFRNVIIYTLGSEVFTAAVMKNSIFWDIRCVVHWKSTDVLEKHVGSIFRVEE